MTSCNKNSNKRNAIWRLSCLTVDFGQSIFIYFIIFSASIYEASATFLYEHSFKFIFFSSSYFCNMRQQMFSMPHLIFDISYTKKDTWKKCKRTRGKKTTDKRTFFLLKFHTLFYILPWNAHNFYGFVESTHLAQAFTWACMLSWLHFTLHHPLPMYRW